MQSKEILILILSLTLSTLCFAQYDSPFHYSKIYHHVPEPYHFNEPWILAKEKEVAEELENYLPIYPVSYLYSEPEYARVRIIRTIQLAENQHLSDAVKHSYWVNNNGVWSVFSDPHGAQPIERDKGLSIDIHITNDMKRLIGLNLESIISDTNIYRRGKSDIEYLSLVQDPNGMYDYNRYIKNKDLVIDSSGILTFTKPYVPNDIEIVSFQTHIINSLNDGSLSAYSNIRMNSMTDALTRAELHERVKDKYIKAIRVKEDYYIDLLTGKFTSQIMGIGLVGVDETLGKELVWCQLPVLHIIHSEWSKAEKCTIFKNRIIDYEQVFNEHLYRSTIDSYERLSTPNNRWVNKDDYHFSVKLDALVALKLTNEIYDYIVTKDDLIQKEGIATFQGKKALKTTIINYLNDTALIEISQQHNNGRPSFKGTMKNSVCDGVFKYYYENGKIKAKRTFVEGVLNGEQINYYENGKVYAKYTTKNDLIQELTRYYKNGHLMEKGSFKNGLIHGEWEYSIEVNPKALALIKEHLTYKEFAESIKKKKIEYRIKYKHYYKPDSYPYYYGDIVEPTSLGYEYIK